MINEILILAFPLYYLLYPWAAIIPLGLLLALVSIFYLIGIKKRRYIYWVPVTILATAVLIYVIFRLLIPPALFTGPWDFTY